MNYIIHTPSAIKLKKEILDRVSEKIDANGKGIVTWQCIETDAGERVLVHTTDQWAEKGCITIKQELGRNELQIRFSNDDDKYMLARFTELVLVHFSYFIDRIVIE